MAEDGMFYQSVSWVPLPGRPRTPPWSVLVTALGHDPDQSLIWDPKPGRWVFNKPGINNALAMAEDEEQFRRLNRAEAERLAASLGFDLPGPVELRRMLEEGEARVLKQRWQASALRMLGQPRVSIGPAVHLVPESTRMMYIASYPNREADRPNGVIAVPPYRRAFQAVAWAPDLGRWIHAPEVKLFLRDSGRDDLKELVDRETAERIAREVLGTEFPSDEEIVRICTEATGEPPPKLP
jgi:hypothetical protein